MFTVVTASIKASATDSIKQHFPFDYQVVADPDRAIPADTVAKLKALPQLGTVAAEYDGKLTLNGQSEHAGAIDAAGYGKLINPIMKQGSISDVVPGTVALAGEPAQVPAHGGRARRSRRPRQTVTP